MIAPHGIQLETHRGFPPSSVLSASRRFIPMSALQDFVINEGLHRWNVRYYLTAIQRNGENDFVLQVAYEVGLYGPAPAQVTEISIEYFAPHSRATRSLQGCSDYVVLEQWLDGLNYVVSLVGGGQQTLN